MRCWPEVIPSPLSPVVPKRRDRYRGSRRSTLSPATFTATSDQHFLVDARPAALIHLAWPGLPNYRDFFHLGRNLPADLAFLEAAVDAGVSQIMVAGTCLEYGMQYGPLTEQAATAPITAYGFAKDALRKSLQFLQQQKPFTLQWMRLFYMYGEGQNPNSLLAQLDRAIDENAPFFNMSARRSAARLSADQRCGRELRIGS